MIKQTDHKYEGADENPCDGHRCPNDGTLLLKLNNDVVCIDCGEIFHPINKNQ